VVASRAAQAFDRRLGLRGGVAIVFTAALLTAANTKAISADDCVQVDIVRAVGAAMNEDRCSFLVRASAFVTGFSGANPVTPKAGDLATVSGETTPWTVQAAALRGGGSYYRLDATRDRDGWDS